MFVAKDAAECFALVIFLCDNYLSIRPEEAASPEARFFDIARRLPQEIQETLCHRAHGESRDLILSQERELAFKKIAMLICN